MSKKIMFASDIHGSMLYCNKMLDAFESHKADKLVLLGDILYHGPRNPMPDGHNPKKVTAILNEYKDKILCVRGNCDCEVDQMVLNFPCLAEYAYIYLDDVTIFATHGHKYNPENLPPLNKGDVLFNGHTHIPMIKHMGDYTYINCGSVSMPKENTAHSYVIFENGEFTLHSL